MTITIGFWVLPILATLALLAWAFLSPMPASRGGSFDFDGLFSSLLRATVVLVGTLVDWLAWALVR